MNSKIINENKITAYIVTGSFFLSLIIGFIAGNPGGIVLMRAFLSAILFGVIFQGALYILRKYVPEIKSLKETEIGGTESEGEGVVEAEVEKTSGTVVDFSTSLDEEQVEPVNVSVDMDEIYEGEGTEGAVESKEATEIDEPEIGEEAVTLDELPSLDNLFEDEEEETGSEGGLPESEIKEGMSATEDYIHIGDARIPNEPKAIAKAIKKVMKQDG